MDGTKVSVCMVTYNHEQYIAQAIQSVLAQETDFPIELVIGEDCSTDNTRSIVCELAEKHGDRIRLRLAESNQGAKANFIGTFGACRGQYVALLEGDDYWTCTDKLQMQVDALDARPDWAMCFHPTQVKFEEGSHEPRVLPASWDKPEATLVDLFAANFIPTSAVLFRNRLFPALPAWFHDTLLGDWPLHILNAAYGNIGFMPDVMSVYRVHANGIWSGLDLGTQLVLTFKMLNAVDHHFAGKYAREIDENRITTLSWLVNGANQGKQLSAEIAALQAANTTLAEEQSRLKAYYESADFPGQISALVEANAWLSAEIAALQASNATLAEEQSRLKAYYESADFPRQISALEQANARLGAEHQGLKTLYDSNNFPDVIAALQESCTRLAEDYRTLKEFHDSKDLPPEIVALNNAFTKLAAENRTLKEFQDGWRKSFAYRIARETRRPFQQMWTKARRLLHRHDDQLPPRYDDDGPASQAA